jgi:hypothetical protein
MEFMSKFVTGFLIGVVLCGKYAVFCDV